MSHSPQQSCESMRIDHVLREEVLAEEVLAEISEPEPEPPFEFEDRTDPDVARELATAEALVHWVLARRARGLLPS